MRQYIEMGTDHGEGLKSYKLEGVNGVVVGQSWGSLSVMLNGGMQR